MNERQYATVILFKPSGKYYTEEPWRIPTREEAEEHADFSPGDAEIPYVMRYSPDFRRISSGAVLVESQEPWGYPHLFPEVDRRMLNQAEAWDSGWNAGANYMCADYEGPEDVPNPYLGGEGL